MKQNGNRQAILSETGGGNTSSCETEYVRANFLVFAMTDFLGLLSLGQELAFVKENSDSIVGFTVWAAGAFDDTYVLTVTPNADGSDQPLWIDAGKWISQLYIYLHNLNDPNFQFNPTCLEYLAAVSFVNTVRLYKKWMLLAIVLCQVLCCMLGQLYKMRYALPDTRTT